MGWWHHYWENELRLLDSLSTNWIIKTRWLPLFGQVNLPKKEFESNFHSHCSPRPRKGIGVNQSQTWQGSFNLETNWPVRKSITSIPDNWPVTKSIMSTPDNDQPLICLTQEVISTLHFWRYKFDGYFRGLFWAAVAHKALFCLGMRLIKFSSTFTKGLHKNAMLLWI